MIRLVLLIFLLAGVMVAPAVAFDDYPPFGAGGPTDLRTFIRFVNLLPGAESVDFYAGTERVASCIAFGTASPRMVVMHGHYVFAANPAGVSAPNAALAQYLFTPMARFYYTMVLSGTLQCPQLFLLEDNLGLPGSGNVRVRLINALQPGTSVTIMHANRRVLFESIPYGATCFSTMRGPICGFTISVDEPFLPVEFPAVSARALVATLVVFGDEETGLRTMVIVER